MIWLFAIILAYFFFSIASLGDKLVLNRSQNPKLYVFYVGVLGGIVVILIPFVGILLPNITSFFWIIVTSIVLVGGLYILYEAVGRFEVSRVVPIVGSVQPIFILVFSWLFFGFSTANSNVLAFLILLIASAIISFEKKFRLDKNLLKFSLVASSLAALGFIVIKMVFLNQTFFNGIIWVGIFNFLIVSTFLFGAKFRKEVFNGKSSFDKKTITLVILTQLSGGLAGLLQNFAIYLAPISSLAIINALRGAQYVFLFIITLIFSFAFPKILKEEISKRVIIQKVVSIFLIIIGIAILVLW